MEISLKHIKIGDIVDGYEDRFDLGCVGYKGKLNIRPAYQREYIYDDRKAVAVIDTIMSGFPLNVMYWVQNSDGTYELLDGQQRTVSFCKFYSNVLDWHDNQFSSLEEDQKRKFLDYEVQVYFCKGTDSEKLDWFRTINIGSVQLTPQELRNAIYYGPWLTEAKRYFSKRGMNPAKQVAGYFLKGSYERQDILETVLKWISDYKGTTIERYMSTHRNDKDADELINYFSNVFEWVNRVFPRQRKEMNGLPWGIWFNKYSATKYNPNKIDDNIAKLMKDPDIKAKKGIYHFELEDESTDSEKYLSLRTFDASTKRSVYERQKGICPICGEYFDIDDMEADHIKPWSKGGKTVESNCQMLCKSCNRKKQNV